MLDMLANMTKGRAKEGDVERMLAMGETMLTSLCGHGQLSVNPIKSSVKYFEKDLKDHIIDKRCPAGRCKELNHA
jgi:NADH:ubiquinone oxidoreductase subunit F (NADH-binding)